MISSEFQELLDTYANNYPDSLLKKFPEQAIEKLNTAIITKSSHCKPSLDTLNNLDKEKENRSREEIIEWMKTNLDYETLCFIGW